jgi:hypothetical protein
MQSDVSVRKAMLNLLHHFILVRNQVVIREIIEKPISELEAFAGNVPLIFGRPTLIKLIADNRTVRSLLVRVILQRTYHLHLAQYPNLVFGRGGDGPCNESPSMAKFNQPC